MALRVCFFALQPDAAASDQIDRLMAERRGSGRPMARARRHVSLAGMSDDTDALDEWALRAVRATSSVRSPPFLVAFNRMASFAGRGEVGALVLRGDEGVLGVDLLHATIHDALASAGLAPRRAGRFEAHLTLARRAPRVDETIVSPIAWTVRDFVLIRSYVGETRYEIAQVMPFFWRCARRGPSKGRSRELTLTI